MSQTTVINNKNIKSLVNDYFGRKQYLPVSLQGVPIGQWDVSNVTEMNYLFSGKLSFNEPLEDWDVSNVKSMTAMFDNCMSFNQPLSKWNVSNVKYMTLMFYGCSKFDQDISDWDVSNVTDSKKMFKGCPIRESYKPDFSNKNRSKAVAAPTEEETKDLEPGDGEWTLGQNQTQGQSSEEPVGGKRRKLRKARKTKTRKSKLRKKRRSKRRQ